MRGRRRQQQQKDEPQVAAAPLEVNALITATAGAMAGAVARFVVGPLDVVKIRFQVQLEPIAAGALPSKYTSLHQAFTTILREEGIKVRSTRMAARRRSPPPSAGVLPPALSSHEPH